ncbi:MAG: TIGR00730 family Rossman fold protein [Deltaproteobacteria bacterium]|nr:TIGR00730 family Rossman fold protein [Deltaproteobacteria bacterium]
MRHDAHREGSGRTHERLPSPALPGERVTKRSLARICVFCASNPGVREDYAVASRRLASELVARDCELVYGGAQVGLMGVMAQTMLDQGGRVIGVIPEVLVSKEIAHPGLTELRVVASMHERKAVMSDLSDGFVALPGGLGTLEELFEVLTWAQLGLHAKPCGILNVCGYFDPLLSFLDHAVDERLLKSKHRALVLTGEDPSSLLDRMAAYQPPMTEKWIARDSA